ncbi:MAG: hypothetical protein RLZZ450_5859 [Pseudomonadota bacterium]|jgi:tetratricopeptide (TPR) repeat protein
MQTIVRACSIWLCLSLLTAASAQDATYLESVTHAIEAYDEGDFESALTYFERAHAQSPNAQTLRGLGIVELELKRFRAAAEHLEQALQIKDHPLDASTRDEVQRAFARALRSVAVLELALEPAAGQLRLNGWPVASPSRHILEPGEHVVEASAAGFDPEKKSLRLAAGERRPLHLTLDRTTREQRVMPRVLTISAAGVALVGLSLLIVSTVDKHKVEDPDTLDWKDSKGPYERAHTLGIAGSVIGGVGVAGVLGGLAWHYFGGAPSERHFAHARRNRALRRTAVLVGPHSVLVRGRF